MSGSPVDNVPVASGIVDEVWAPLVATSLIFPTGVVVAAPNVYGVEAV